MEIIQRKRPDSGNCKHTPVPKSHIASVDFSNVFELQHSFDRQEQATKSYTRGYCVDLPITILLSPSSDPISQIRTDGTNKCGWKLETRFQLLHRFRSGPESLAYLRWIHTSMQWEQDRINQNLEGKLQSESNYFRFQDQDQLLRTGNDQLSPAH